MRSLCLPSSERICRNEYSESGSIAESTSASCVFRADETLERWHDIGNKLVPRAQDFPQDKYDYKLKKDQRTFADSLLHLAAVDYDLRRSTSGSTIGPDFAKHIADRGEQPIPPPEPSDICRRPRLRSLRTDSGVFADERNCAASERALRRNQRSTRGRSATCGESGRRWNSACAKSLLRCCLGFNPSAESGLPQRIAFANQQGTAGKLGAASFAEHGLPLLHAALIPGFVLTVESPAYFCTFRNFNRVSHAQKIARPRLQDQITVVVERPGAGVAPGQLAVRGRSTGSGPGNRRVLLERPKGMGIHCRCCSSLIPGPHLQPQSPAKIQEFSAPTPRGCPIRALFGLPGWLVSRSPQAMSLSILSGDLRVSTASKHQWFTCYTSLKSWRFGAPFSRHT